MSKYLMLLVAGLMVVGCSGSKDAELKAYVAGCSETAQAIGMQLGFGIQEDKLLEICGKQAQEYLKNKRK